MYLCWPWLSMSVDWLEALGILLERATTIFWRVHMSAINSRRRNRIVAHQGTPCICSERHLHAVVACRESRREMPWNDVGIT